MQSQAPYEPVWSQGTAPPNIGNPVASLSYPPFARRVAWQVFQTLTVIALPTLIFIGFLSTHFFFLYKYYNIIFIKCQIFYKIQKVDFQRALDRVHCTTAQPKPALAAPPAQHLPVDFCGCQPNPFVCKLHLLLLLLKFLP